MEFGLVLMESGPRGACLLGGALRGSVVGGAERAGYVPITRPERELVRRSSAWRGRRQLVAPAIEFVAEKNSPLDGAGAGPSMASDTPRGAAGIRLLDELKPFQLG